MMKKSKSAFLDGRNFRTRMLTCNIQIDPLNGMKTVPHKFYLTDNLIAISSQSHETLVEIAELTTPMKIKLEKKMFCLIIKE